MSITIEKVQQWLKKAKHSIIFGYIQASLSVPKYERALELIKLALNTRERGRVCYVVHDRLSQVSMTSYCNSRLPQDAQVRTITISDVLNLADRWIEEARNNGKYYTVIFEADLNASLEYCWPLVKFMLAGAGVLSPRQIAVMVVSDVGLNEVRYLEEALATISKNSQSWELFSMTGRDSVPSCIKTTVQSHQDLFSRAKAAIEKLESGELMMVCGAVTFVAELRGIAGDHGVSWVQPEAPKSMHRPLDELLELVERTWALRSSMVIHLSGTKSLVAPLSKLKSIFVFPQTSVDAWDSGHIVHSMRGLKQCELDNLVEGHVNQATDMKAEESVNAFVVDHQAESGQPPSQYEQGQLAAFVWRFYAAHVPKRMQSLLLPVLSGSADKVHEITRRLYWLGCLEEGLDGDSSVVWVPVRGQRSAVLPKLLPVVGHNFEAAWFLSSCFGGPMSDATDSVKKLMVRLAVLKTDKTNLYHMLPYLPQLFELDDEQKEKLMRDILQVTKSCDLAKGTINKGWLWSRVLLWHQVSSMQVGTSGTSAAEAGLNSDVGISVQLCEYRRSLHAIQTLDDYICPGAPADLPLTLTAHDRERVHLEMAASWMFSSIWVVYEGDRITKAKDLVHFREVDIVRAQLPPTYLLRSSEAGDGLALAIPMFFENDDNGLVGHDMLAISRRTTSRLLQRFPEDNMDEVFQSYYFLSQ